MRIIRKGKEIKVESGQHKCIIQIICNELLEDADAPSDMNKVPIYKDCLSRDVKTDHH